MNLVSADVQYSVDDCEYILRLTYNNNTYVCKKLGVTPEENAKKLRELANTIEGQL